MKNDVMKPTQFRAILKDDGRRTQRDVFDAFLRTGDIDSYDTLYPEIPVDTSKVPVIVNAKQFDAIQLRRRVRAVIEKARIEAGRPKDNRRVGEFKSLQKHLQARNRVRGAGGTFVPRSVKEENIDGIPSLCN